MAKKVSDVVMGMLSDAGSATRAPLDIPGPPVDPTPPAAQVARPTAPASDPAPVSPPAAVAPPPAASAEAPDAPRTLRLRSDAAARLRAAWLEAKRQDVLLTAQDFASDLIEEALVSRRRRHRTPAPA
jgi:hypothetical protein